MLERRNYMNEFMNKCYKCLERLAKNLPFMVYSFNEERTRCLIKCQVINKALTIEGDNVDECLAYINNIADEWEMAFYQALNEEREDNARANGKR